MKRCTAKPPRERDVYISTGTVGRGPFSSCLASRMRGGYPPYSEINKGGIKTVCPTCFLSHDMRMRGGYNLCEQWRVCHKANVRKKIMRAFGKMHQESCRTLAHASAVNGILAGAKRHTAENAINQQEATKNRNGEALPPIS